jgi:hypothetical protein
MGAVLFSVGGIDQFEHGRVGLGGRHVPREAARGDAGLARGRSAARGLGDAVPAAAVSADSAHVDVIAGADDPDRSRLPRRPVAADRGDLDLLDCA